MTVQMRFCTSDTTATAIYFRSSEYGVRICSMTTIEPETRIVSIVTSATQTVYMIQHQPQQWVTLRYELVMPADVVPALINPTNAIISTSWFTSQASGLFCIPASFTTHRIPTVSSAESNNRAESEQITVELSWTMPVGWSLCNSFGVSTANDYKQRIITSAETLFHKAVFAGAKDCIVRTIPLNDGGTIYFATLKHWEDKVDTIAKSVRALLQSHRTFADKKPTEGYAAIMFPVVEEPDTYRNGLATQHGFRMFLADRFDIHGAEFRHALAHEMFHSWNNDFLVETTPLLFGMTFIEGFTEYMASEVLLAAGLITRSDYLYRYNAILRDYHTMEYRHADEATITKLYNTVPQARSVVYRRGEILAHQWDAEIRSHSAGRFSFATALRSIMQTYSRIDERVFVAALEPFIGRNIMPDITRFMKNGELVETSADALPFAEREYIQVNVAGSMTSIPQYRLRSQK